jgi:hypothetical protein
MTRRTLRTAPAILRHHTTQATGHHESEWQSRLNNHKARDNDYRPKANEQQIRPRGERDGWVLGDEGLGLGLFSQVKLYPQRALIVGNRRLHSSPLRQVNCLYAD